MVKAKLQRFVTNMAKTMNWALIITQ